MRAILRTLLIVVVAPALTALAQEQKPAAPAAPANPITTHGKGMFNGVTKIILRAAENMPEEHYGFKPVETVRTFGQIVAHVADSQYFMCASVLGEKPESRRIEKTKTTKSEIVAALREAFAYCQRAHDSLTDASSTEMVKHMNSTMPKHGILEVNSIHSIEHYGNLLTYMRIKGLVPPTSEPEFMKELSKD